MGLFRKRPVIIEAVRLDGVFLEGGNRYSVLFDIEGSLPKWLRDALLDGGISPVLDNPPQVVIRTLEGEMLAGKGDWIIRGVKGELYPCKPEIFEKTYDPVDEKDIEVTGIAI